MSTQPDPRDAAVARPDDGAEQPLPPMREMVLESIGGWRGFLDSGLPAVAFVIANMIGGLQPAIWAGAVCAVLIFLLRIVRRESTQQAIAGLLGVGICIFIARQTGEARGFFVFGIVRSAIVALVLFGSMVARWPLVGVVWNFLSPSEQPWREDARQMRAFQWLTAAWAMGFVAKFAIEGYLYLIDSPTGLGAMRIVLGYPLTIGLLLLTLLVATRARGDRGTSAEPRDASAS